MGLLFAFSALVAFGLGDFLIQRSSRRLGSVETLFFITLFGAVVFLPFAWQDFFILIQDGKINELMLLLLCGCFITVAGILDFQALKIGKISVVEPVFSLELIVTTLLAGFFINEKLSAVQAGLVGSLIIGLSLVTVSSFNYFKRIIWEKGVGLALTATLVLGTVNFLFGVSARATNPLVVNWFVSFFIMLVCLIYFIVTKRTYSLREFFWNNKKLILATAFSDNLAWFCYAASMVYIPIAVATGISESYIALAVILGLVFNKEKLKVHQVVGLAVTLTAAITLAFLTA